LSICFARKTNWILNSKLLDITRAKLDPKSVDFDKEFDDDLIGAEASRKRIRPAVNDLSEYGKKYKGKNVSRKDIMDDDEDEDEDEDEEEDDDNESEKSQDEDEDEDEEDEDEEDEDEDEDEESEGAKKNKNPKQVSEKSDKDLSLIKMDRKDEIAKGKAVKNQLSKPANFIFQQTFQFLTV
jgi:hypothetical protein